MRPFGEILNEATTVCGDRVTATGSCEGFGTPKVGDFVVDVTSGAGRVGRFVVEARASALSPKAMLAELNAAAENRDATAALFVTDTVEYGWKNQPLQKVAPCRCVVVAERDDYSQLALRVAYQMARANVLAQLAESSEDNELDIDALIARLEHARATLDATSTIKRVLTSAEKAIARAKASLETMRGSIQKVFFQIESDLVSPD